MLSKHRLKERQTRCEGNMGDFFFFFFWSALYDLMYIKLLARLP